MDQGEELMTAAQWAERSAAGKANPTSKLSIALGALCVLTLVGLAVSIFFIAGLVNTLEDLPDVCDAVFENFDDGTLEPEISSIGIGVISVANQEMRHGLGDDSFDPLNPVTVTFLPSKLPTYIGVTAESVGRNGLRIRAFRCDSGIPSIYDRVKFDVDDGPQEFQLIQEGADVFFCSMEISQVTSLPGDGMGISQIVMAYPCTPSGVVADLPKHFLRASATTQMVVPVTITSVFLVAFVAVTIYRRRILSRVGGTATQVKGAYFSSPVASMKTSLTSSKSTYALRKKEKQEKKEQLKAEEAQRKAELQARKAAEKASRRLLHEQHAGKLRQGTAKTPKSPEVKQPPKYGTDDDIF